MIMPTWPQWMTQRKRVLLIVSLFVALFVGAEIVGRLLERYAGISFSRSAGYLNANPYLRSALAPGFRFDTGKYRIEVNSLGFRGPEIAVPKTPGTFRIFALGESSTFGWKGARSHDEAWPALLESKLRAAYPARKIEVVNAGVPGYTSIEQRINFMLRISKLQPDALVIYHGNNDLGWSGEPDIETKLVYARSRDVASPITWVDRAIDHTYVGMYIRGRIAFQRRASEHQSDEVDKATIRMLKDNLQGLVDDARSRNVKVAIGTFAHGFDEKGVPGIYNGNETGLRVPAAGSYFTYLTPQGLRRSFPVYNEMIRQIAKTNSLPLAEPALKIPPTVEYLSDWCHFTAAGEQRMAEIWFETIEKAGWLAIRSNSATPSGDAVGR